jgi:peptidoglycan hydrolase CwlO-like protein
VAGALAAVTLGLSSVTGAIVATAPAAHGQEDPEVTQARQALQQAQEDANAAHDRYQKALDERDQAEAKITSLEQAIPDMRTREAGLRAQLSTRAAALYKNTDPSGGLDVLASQDLMNAARKTQLTKAATDFDETRARQLHDTADQLQHAQDELTSRRAELDALLPQLDREKATFDAKVEAANRALQVAEELGALRKLGEPVMGPSVLNAQEIVAWYRSTGSTPRLSDVTMDELAQIFLDEGAAENVRGDMAFAQAYVETGGFSAGGRDNNFSGLGACDGCAGERQFPTARDGIRAQIQHLRNYADRNSRASDLANPPSPYWYGADPATAARNFDTFFAKGWAPVWQMMGHGNWATDPNYASKVIGVFNRMVASRG